MKKLSVILLSLILLLSATAFAACEIKREDKRRPSSSASSQVTPSASGELYTVTVTDGTIKGTGESTGQFAKGTQVTIVFNAQNGIEFYEWDNAADDEYLSEDEEYTFTVTRDIEIYAYYGITAKTFDNPFDATYTAKYTGANQLPKLPANFAFAEAEYALKDAAGNLMTLPNGLPLTEAINPGTYYITVTLSANGYATTPFNTVLTIEAGTLPTDFVRTTVTYTPGVSRSIKVINMLADEEATITYYQGATVVEEPIDAGEYTVTGVFKKAYYHDKTVTGTLVIEKANGIISLAQDVVYYTAAQAASGISSLTEATLNNNEQSLIFKFIDTATHQEVAAPSASGTYTVIITAAESVNYKAPVEKRMSLVISENVQVAADDEENLKNIQFVDKTVDYNGFEQSIDFTGTYNTELYSVSKRYTTQKNAGKYNALVRFTNIETGKYKDFTASFEIKVVPLTVAVPQYTHVQGAVMPNIRQDTIAAIAGFVGNDDVSVLSGRLALEYDIVRISDVGEYPITIATGRRYASPNYNITFVDGKMNIVIPEYEQETDWSKISPKLRPSDAQIASGDYVLGLQYSSSVSSLTTLYGKEWYGQGVNFYSMMQMLYGGAEPDEVLAHLELLASYNVKTIRFSLLPYYYYAYGSFIDYQGTYYRNLDAIVKKCEEVGIGLVPSFFWTASVQDYFDEGIMSALVNENSKSRKYMADFIAKIVKRYSTSPAIFMWEYGNEWNLGADFPGWTVADNASALPNGSQRASRTEAEDKTTNAALQVAFNFFANTIHANDPSHRCIGNGDAVYRKSQWNQSNGGGWTTDTMAQHEKAFEIWNPNQYMNMVSWHVYAGESYLNQPTVVGAYSENISITTWSDYMTHIKAKANRIGKTCYFGEVGPSFSGVATASDYIKEKRIADACGNALMQTHFPLTMAWNYDPKGTLLEGRPNERSGGTEWSWFVQRADETLGTFEKMEQESNPLSALSNPRGYYELISIKETNDAIDAGASSATRRFS